VIATSQTLKVMEEVQGRSLWVDARRRLFRNRAAMAGIVILGLTAALALLAPLLSPYAYNEVNYDIIACAPDWWPAEAACRAPGHIFGTTLVGRDLFVRVLFGRGCRWRVGTVATLVSLLIGVLYGAAAGYLGGRTDALMMRLVDILYSLPFVFFVIILMVMFDRNFILLFVAIGAVEWLTMARIVRGQTLSIKQKEFIEAARAGGVSPFAIITRHIIPMWWGWYGLCHLDGAGCDPDRKSSFLGLYPGTAHELKRVDFRWRRPNGNRALDAAVSCFVHGGDLSASTIGDGCADALDPKIGKDGMARCWKLRPNVHFAPPTAMFMSSRTPAFHP
jgi:ABC-type dipeptide/oligopeptide/nickel transport system permease subunit